jgi:tetratricopeptide (TPR) repeat protein
LCNAFIQENPHDPHGYFDRHLAWDRLGRHDLALADIESSIRLKPDSGAFDARGCVLRQIGRYEEAIEDFNRAAALDPESWYGGPGPIFRADCHARLGNLEAALADCEHFPDDMRWPGPFGLPSGGKEDVKHEMRRRALAVRASGSQS